MAQGINGGSGLSGCTREWWCWLFEAVVRHRNGDEEGDRREREMRKKKGQGQKCNVFIFLYHIYFNKKYYFSYMYCFSLSCSNVYQ